MQQDFTTVTEVPGVRATRQALSHMYTRYHWAAGYVRDKEVLELACGSGPGLGYFVGRGARRVEGTDIEQKNLRHAENYYAGREEITLAVVDATDMPYADETFDVIVNFEAIYYMADVAKALREAYRILRPGGCLLVSSVNCDWHGFNPSPFSIYYLNAAELQQSMQAAGFAVSLKAAFPDRPDSLVRKVVGALRTLATRLHLIPKTMRGKQLLKRLFYGELQPIPHEIEDGRYALEPLVEIDPVRTQTDYTFLYAEGRK